MKLKKDRLMQQKANQQSKSNNSYLWRSLSSLAMVKTFIKKIQSSKLWHFASRPIVYIPILLGVLLTAPFFSTSSYYRHMLIIILVYVILSMSLNLIMGYTGQLALGHAAFYGIGAYTFALLVLKTSTPYWIAFILGGVMASIWAILLGTIVLRLRGHYVAIVTLAFGEIVRIVLVNWVSLTNGPMGLTGIPRPSIFSYTFSGPIPYYYLVLFLAVITYFVLSRIIDSRQGRAFIAIREEETASLAMGIRTTQLKILSYVISCFFAGLAGSFLAGYIRFIHPDNFTAWGSIIMNGMIVIGGEGSMVGAAIGAALLTITPELLRFLQNYRMAIYGVSMILAIIFMPYGLVGRPKPKKTDEEADNFSGGRLDGGFYRSALQTTFSTRNAPTKVSTASCTEIGTPVLKLSGVTMTFGGLTALKDISLKVQSGEIHSIIGPNGAGKTTLFNVLSGFYRPKAGSILFQGDVLVGKSPDEICRLGIARTFQRIRLFRLMTCLDNILVGCDSVMKSSWIDSLLRTKRFKLEERYIRARAATLLNFVNLTHRRNQFVLSLPYGEQRRLEIARALATNVKILLLDEPTAGMSSEETSAVIELIRRVKREMGLTIILIEHDMRVVMGISDIVTVLDHGTKIAEGTPKEIQENEIVIQAYLGTDAEV